MARVAGARNAQFEERRNALIEKAKERLSLQDGQSPSFRELALAAGVGVRFVVELEAGKPTVQLAQVLRVVEALGGSLQLTGVDHDGH